MMLPISTVIDKPFILYSIQDKFIRGVYPIDYNNEIFYNQYKNQFQIYREERINEILK